MKSNRATLMLAVLLALNSVALASTTWYVNGVSGSDSNNCTSPTTACKTIGHAISQASWGDTVIVAPATYTENLNIGFSLTITGANAKKTVIDGGQNGTVVMISNASARVAISKVTIRNGSNSGIGNFGMLTISGSTITGNITQSLSFCRGGGGGIENKGVLTINSSTVSGNTTTGGTGCGGGIYNTGTLVINSSTVSGNENTGGTGDGGGIYSAGTLAINNSTVSGNFADATYFGYGGGIFNRGTLAINNSTISGNFASAGALERSGSAYGGGIYVGSGGVFISNSTISGNRLQPMAGGAAQGGGIDGAATFQDSIMSNNSAGGNCYGTMTSDGYNLSSDSTCNFNGPGDLNNTDPKLGPLQNNGGPTQTMALSSGSPAIDAGNPNGCTDGSGHLLATDQRGMPRPDPEDTGGCDMGAYERQID